jgi:hypothetical protein
MNWMEPVPSVSLVPILSWCVSEPGSHRCYLREVASECELTKETIYLLFRVLAIPTNSGGNPGANLKSIAHS